MARHDGRVGARAPPAARRPGAAASTSTPPGGLARLPDVVRHEQPRVEGRPRRAPRELERADAHAGHARPDGLGSEDDDCLQAVKDPRCGRPSPSPPQPVEKQVQLPGPRGVDLVQEAVEPLDLDVRREDEAVVLLVLGEDLRQPRVEELVLGRQPRTLALALPFRAARAPRRARRWLSAGSAARPARCRRGRTRRRPGRACGRAPARGPRPCAARRTARRSSAARPGRRRLPPRRGRDRSTDASKTRYSQVTARRCRNGVSAASRIRKSQSSEYSRPSSKPPTLRVELAGQQQRVDRDVVGVAAGSPGRSRASTEASARAAPSPPRPGRRRP